MIPESKLVEIIRRIEHLNPSPEALARHIVRESYKVLVEEKAPESAKLVASCRILSNYVKSGRELEIYTANIGQLYLGDDRTLDGTMAPDLATCIVDYAEKLLRGPA